ncbi:phage tail assembly protein [Paenibacillus apiarius]|uniref:phage tail assembly protein n=1 Tax=Paenibacillus apiarius TaxID=46240 RepID=UPI003B3BE50A
MGNQQHTEQTMADERVYKLVRPISFDGEEVKELVLDFDELTGRDLLACARQAQTMAPDEVAFVRALSLPYQVVVAAKAAAVPAELIQSLKAKDFTQVTQRAQIFLTTQE